MYINIDPPPGSGAKKQTVTVVTENSEIDALLLVGDYCFMAEKIPRTRKAKVELINSIIGMVWKRPAKHYIGIAVKARGAGKVAGEEK